MWMRGVWALRVREVRGVLEPGLYDVGDEARLCMVLMLGMGNGSTPLYL